MKILLLLALSCCKRFPTANGCKVLKDVPTDTFMPVSTVAPTSVPTVAPTSVPTVAPTSVPTVVPTDVPTDTSKVHGNLRGAAPTPAPTMSTLFVGQEYIYISSSFGSSSGKYITCATMTETAVKPPVFLLKPSVSNTAAYLDCDATVFAFEQFQMKIKIFRIDFEFLQPTGIIATIKIASPYLHEYVGVDTSGTWSAMIHFTSNGIASKVSVLGEGLFPLPITDKQSLVDSILPDSFPSMIADYLDSEATSFAFKEYTMIVDIRSIDIAFLQPDGTTVTVVCVSPYPPVNYVGVNSGTWIATIHFTSDEIASKVSIPGKGLFPLRITDILSVEITQDEPTA